MESTLPPTERRTDRSDAEEDLVGANTSITRGDRDGDKDTSLVLTVKR